MKGVSLPAKLAFAGVLLVALAAYVSVVDLGVSAGRIHRGVTIGTIDVGGMTQSEASGRLESVGREMRNAPITFTVGTFVTEILPADLRWWPYADYMAARAMSVGRRGGWVHAASKRWQAWIGGVEVKWRKPGSGRVERRIGELSVELGELGYDLDEEAMRRMLKLAIWEWPRRDSYAIPLSED